MAEANFSRFQGHEARFWSWLNSSGNEGVLTENSCQWGQIFRVGWGKVWNPWQNIYPWIDLRRSHQRVGTNIDFRSFNFLILRKKCSENGSSIAWFWRKCPQIVKSREEGRFMISSPYLGQCPTCLLPIQSSPTPRRKTFLYWLDWWDNYKRG